MERLDYRTIAECLTICSRKDSEGVGKEWRSIRFSVATIQTWCKKHIKRAIKILACILNMSC